MEQIQAFGIKVYINKYSFLYQCISYNNVEENFNIDISLYLILRLIENKFFEAAVLTIILIHCVLLAMEDINFQSSQTLVNIVYYIDGILTHMILIEACIKLFSMGFVAYFSNFWCWLDFIVVGMSLINFYAGLLGLQIIAIFKVQNP